MNGYRPIRSLPLLRTLASGPVRANTQPGHSEMHDSSGKHAQEFIRRSPFLCIGTEDLDGRVDVSPRGRGRRRPRRA